MGEYSELISNGANLKALVPGANIFGGEQVLEVTNLEYQVPPVRICQP